MNKLTQLYLTQDSKEALNEARKSGFTKSGFASQAIVEKAERDGLIKRKQYKENSNER